MRDVFMGVDVGTSSVKGVVVSEDGEILGRAVRTHRTSMPRPGWAEHDPEEHWWSGLRSICGQLIDPETRVVAIGISGIGPCLLPADSDSRPLRPAILYGIDTRATKEIETQNQRFGITGIIERAGSPLTSQAIGPKIEWLANNEPSIYEKTRRFFMASSYLTYRLTDSYVLDHHSASQAVPLYDLHQSTWALDWCEQLAPNIELPELLWPYERAGSVTKKAADETGLPPGIPVIAGTIDAWAEAHSVGVRGPGDLMVMYGSTMFLIQIVSRVRSNQSIWMTNGIEPDTYSLAGGMATSGLLIDWLLDVMGSTHEDLSSEAERAGVGSGGLLVLPHLAGERTPIHDADARGVIAGLTLQHGRGHLYRAALEGVAFGVRHILEQMADTDAAADRIVAVGGGAQSELWCQIVSDVLGRAQELPMETIGAALGDAMLAAKANSVDTTSWNPTTKLIQPRHENRQVYEEMYRRFLSLYPATRDTSHALSHLQGELLN